MFTRIKRFFTRSSSDCLIKPETPPPYTVWSGSKKIIKGIVVLGVQMGVQFIFKQFSSSEPQETSDQNSTLNIVTSAGYALMLEGAFEITNVAVLHIYKKVEEASEIPRRRRGPGSHTNTKTAEESATLFATHRRKEVARYHNVLMVQNVLHSFLGITTTVYSIIRCVRGISDYPAGVSIFDFSFPEGTPLRKSIFNFLNAPISNTVSIVLLSLGAIYNIRELRLSFSSARPRRGDVPFFGFINAYSQLGISAEIGYITRPIPFPNMDIYDPTGTNYMAILALIQKMHEMSKPNPYHRFAKIGNGIAGYYIYKNLMQVASNLINAMALKHKRSTVQIEEMEDSITAPGLPRPGAVASRKVSVPQSSGSLHPQPMRSLIDHQRAYGAGQSRSADLNSAQQSESVFPKKRRNAREVPTPFSRLSSAAASAATTPPAPDIKDSDELFRVDEHTREKGLAEVNHFRSLSQVSSGHINAALNRLKHLLPNGRLSPIDGSEHQLTWRWNDKNYRLKYEIAHGANSNQFSGNKLDKILNVIEAALLWQWDNKKREEYLSARVGGRGLEPLYYIFSERPK